MKTIQKHRLFFSIVCLLAVVLFACSRRVKKKIEINSGFATYISAYTSGVISKRSTIQIRLAADYEGDENITAGKIIDKNLFSFQPSMSGKTQWLDSRTIEFVPDNAFEPGKEYNASFNLSELMEIPKEFKVFEFSFITREQVYWVYFDGLSTYENNNLKRQKLEGRLQINDYAESEQVNKMITARQNNKELKIEWINIDPLNYRFVVHEVQRGDKKSFVKVEWNASAINAKGTGERVIEVPALGDFKITEINVNQTPEQFVTIHFSDPIMPNQSFNGLISVKNAYNLNYVAEGHKVMVYPSYRLSGITEVNVYRGIKNIHGYACPDEKSVEVEFEELKPDVRAVGEGVIVPTSEKGMLFTFEAVNLKAVDVQVMRVYENNIVQFLQVNNMDGNSQLKRVGKNILQKRIELNKDGKLKLNDWNRFSIDLAEIIKPEQGALYRVEIKFNKNYSNYPCNGSFDNSELTELQPKEEKEWTEKHWGNYDYGYYYDYDYDYDDYYYYDYDYRERDNPCHTSYYHGKGLTKNILISDIGIVAKAGSDRVLNVFLNDIKTTNPLNNCQVEFYDFQQQKIGQLTTDSKGMGEIKLDEKPFVLIAKKGTQRGYLRMRDGEALSMSKFDVSGETVQKGVKGFIYTERGVWRPGDSIYLSFILEDIEKMLPVNHPVTMEIYNPMGTQVQKIIRTKHVNGVYDFRTTTSPDAPTGYYTAYVKVGNREFNKSLRIETVKPNRLKVYIDFGKEMLSKFNTENIIKLNSKWLHGAPAKNLRTKVDVTVNQASTSFTGFKDFVFEDPTLTFSSEEQTIFDDNLDEEGNTTFDADLNIGDHAPGMLRASFITRVFEEGGDFSIDRQSVMYSPYQYYVGVKAPKGNDYYGTLETDKDHTVEIATVDANGKAVSRRNIEVKVYQIQWRWWWDNYNRDLSSYIASNSVTPVLDTRINTTNGKGKFVLRINRPSWGRYLIYVKDPEGGHACGQTVYIDWPYWARANRKDNENASMLSFSTDKQKYNVGEQIKVTIPSSSKGRALICIESGTRVIEKYSIETQEGETRFEFTATEKMAPNVFVNVSLLQPHAATENDLPIRLYGVIPVSVENPNSHLYPVVSLPDVLRPESKATITVKEDKGRPMTYTIAMVDEGLLDLTNFKTPDPWKHFYSREALGVKTWDLYDQVMGAYAAKLDKLLALGGDGEGDGKKGAKANRFKPMVWFSGPHKLNASATASHTMEIPNYVGSVRVMVIAREENAYGNTEKTVAVRNPLMVLATLPRVLSPGETVQLPVNVFAMEPHVKDVSIEILPNEFFKPKNKTKQNLKFKKIGDEVVNFELDVIQRTGVGKVKVLARSGNETAKHEIEIEVRTPNPKITDVKEAVIEPGKDWSHSFALKGIEGTNSVTLEVSSIPQINLGNRLKYLISYPHGCVEQTTSAAFPQLYLSNIMELDNNFKVEINKNINAALARLQLFQTPEGGFGYWPGSTDNSEWGTNYAGHFMLEAETKGYKISSVLKQNWIKYQQKMARNWRANTTANSYYGSAQYDDLTQAYRLYTLALVKQPETGAMNRLREMKNLSLPARWRLAAAYYLSGQQSIAQKLTEGSSTNVPKYTELSYTFGNDVRDKAMILETMSLTKDKAKAAVLMKEIAKELNTDKWMSTQTTAYCLMAVSKYVGISPSDKTMTFTYSVDGSQATTKNTQLAVFQQKLKIVSAARQGKLSLSNKGKGTLYVKVTAEGVPPVGSNEINEMANNVKLRVDYYTTNGKSLDVSKLEQGTDFIAEVTISNPGTRGFLAEMALNQMFASGWEIHNVRMDDFASATKSDYATYQDIRDDRVYTYYNVGANNNKTFRFKLNAAYIGKFWLPAVTTEAMYDNTINARIKGRWVEVVKQGYGYVSQNDTPNEKEEGG